MKKILLALLVIQLFGCGKSEVSKLDAEIEIENAQAGLEKIVVQLAEAEVSAILKDGDSAKFNSVEVFPQYGRLKDGRQIVSNHYVVCGQVNAKNSYGGYTGFTRFVASVTTNNKKANHAFMLDSTDTTVRKTYDSVYADACRSVEFAMG